MSEKTYVPEIDSPAPANDSRPTSLHEIVMRSLQSGVDGLACELHNNGACLTGNTQASDLEWLARSLFEASNLGAGSIQTIDWLIGHKQWATLGLTQESIFGDGPRQFDGLNEEQRNAWIKLARIVMYVIPAFAERVGHRWMQQAEAIRAVWRETRER